MKKRKQEKERERERNCSVFSQPLKIEEIAQFDVSTYLSGIKIHLQEITRKRKKRKEKNKNKRKIRVIKKKINNIEKYGKIMRKKRVIERYR